MNTKVISSFILASATIILATGCCSKVNTTWGAQVYVPKCIEQIKYSGNSFKIGETTIPLETRTITIKGVEWDVKKLQDAAPAIQLMEQTRLRGCEERVINLQSLQYVDYLTWKKKNDEIGEKLDQLAYLVTLNDSQAVNKWIDHYLITVPNTKAITVGNAFMMIQKTKLSDVETDFKMISNDNADVEQISFFRK